MKNYSIGIADGARTEFHQTLGLTGAEVSFNSLPAGVSVPFVHSHKENEEIYIITDRKAKEKGNIIQFKIEKLQGEQPNIIMKALGDKSLGWIELIKK